MCFTATGQWVGGMLILPPLSVILAFEPWVGQVKCFWIFGILWCYLRKSMCNACCLGFGWWLCSRKCNLCSERCQSHQVLPQRWPSWSRIQRYKVFSACWWRWSHKLIWAGSACCKLDGSTWNDRRREYRVNWRRCFTHFLFINMLEICDVWFWCNFVSLACTEAMTKQWLWA